MSASPSGRGIPTALLVLGVLGWAGLVVFNPQGWAEAAVYLPVAGLGTAMAIAGSLRRVSAQRRVWLAVAVGQLLFLGGDALWYLYDYVWMIAPYPSVADGAYLLRYACLVVALCWLVRGRRSARDHAAFLDAAVVSSALALLATVFLVLPAVPGTSVSVLSNVVAAAYPIGDVLVLAVLIRLVTRRSIRNVAFISLAVGLLVYLSVDVFYIHTVASGNELPAWMTDAYLVPYLLIGFAAMHPSSGALTSAAPSTARGPTATKVVVLGCALVLGPALLASGLLVDLTGYTLAIALGTALSAVLVLARLLDLLRVGEAQSVQLGVLARTDSLTGLANRRTWDHELERAATVAAAEGTSLTVALIDLDHFKRYNDAHGHIAGDRVLKETAAAWADVLDSSGFIARYGGEEFALLIPRHTAAEAAGLLHRLHQAVTGGQTCSMGVAEWRRDEAPHLTTDRADQALYEAKRGGRDQITVHQESGLHVLPPVAQPAMAADLRIVFQPIVDIQTGDTVGHEALSRFPSLTPFEAFAEARRTGTATLLETAAIKAALEGHRGPGWLSLNVSLGTLLGPEIHEVLPADLTGIVLEITEYEQHADTMAASARLAALRARGACIAVDDFGVGFSNVNRLLWIEPEIIKLDISVVRGVHEKRGHLAMIRGLGVYAQDSGARLCAEGIETTDEWHALAAAGVALGQGYLFGRPGPHSATPSDSPQASVAWTLRPRHSNSALSR